MRLLPTCYRQIASLRSLCTTRVLGSATQTSPAPDKTHVLSDEVTKELYYDGQVVRLLLTAPERRNVLSLAVMERMYSELEAADTEQRSRVVILAGEAPAFSAGHDLRELTIDKGVEGHKKVLSQCTHLMQFIQRMKLPVIAEVEGMAAAAGCQLATSCDLVVASENATFAIPALKSGLFGSTPAIPLVRNVPRKLAMDILVTARVIDAKEALQAGLVSRIVPAGEARVGALKVAEEILPMSRSVTALGKSFFYAQIDMNVANAYRLGESVMCENLKLADAQEGINSFVNKKQPAWTHSDDKVL